MHFEISLLFLSPLSLFCKKSVCRKRSLLVAEIESILKNPRKNIRVKFRLFIKFEFPGALERVRTVPVYYGRRRVLLQSCFSVLSHF
jgi:hypothetical protein